MSFSRVHRGEEAASAQRTGWQECRVESGVSAEKGVWKGDPDHEDDDDGGSGGKTCTITPSSARESGDRVSAVSRLVAPTAHLSRSDTKGGDGSRLIICQEKSGESLNQQRDSAYVSDAWHQQASAGALLSHHVWKCRRETNTEEAETG